MVLRGSINAFRPSRSAKTLTGVTLPRLGSRVRIPSPAPGRCREFGNAKFATSNAPGRRRISGDRRHGFAMLEPTTRPTTIRSGTFSPPALWFPFNDVQARRVPMRVLAFATAASLAALSACSSPSNDSGNNSNVMMANDTLMANDMAANDVAADPAAANTAAPAATPTDAAGVIKTAAASDLYETQSSQLALDTSKNKDVRDFAQMMITDHAKTTAGVKAAAAKADITVSPPTLSADQQQMLDTLKQLSGDAFDKAYLSQQLPAHQQALALMQSYAASGDTPALQDAAKTAIPIVQKHIARLQELTK
ncbi:DUF4142 domain-containing protein [Sphingomonas koreensis]|nr:DUF4142 domain-containing protein [Sphingomonas koreensis]